MKLRKNLPCASHEGGKESGKLGKNGIATLAIGGGQDGSKRGTYAERK